MNLHLPVLYFIFTLPCFAGVYHFRRTAEYGLSPGTYSGDGRKHISVRQEPSCNENLFSARDAGTGLSSRAEPLSYPVSVAQGRYVPEANPAGIGRFILLRSIRV